LNANFTEDDYLGSRQRFVYHELTLPFREITQQDEYARLKIANELFLCAISGKTISNAKLKSALTPLQYQNYLNSLHVVVENSEILYGDGMPDELRDYNIKLRKADFVNGQYERMSGQVSIGKAHYKHGIVAKKLDKAESLYEDALLRLDEIYSVASPEQKFELDKWMDREIDFDKGHDSKLSIDNIGIPRVKGSKSMYAEDSGLPKLSSRLKKREMQLKALLVCAFELTYEYVQPEEKKFSPQEMSKLSSMLDKLRNWRK